MSLTEEERERLADVVRLQPTKNGELQDKWGLDSGSEVHHYLEDNLGDYYYRDDNSLIRATDDAAEVTDAEPAIEGGGDGEGDGIPSRIRVPEIQSQVFAVLAGPEDRSQSVVSTLRGVREEFGADPSAEDVRDALQSLRRKDVVEVIYRTVPTFRRTVDHEEITVEVAE